MGGNAFFFLLLLALIFGVGGMLLAGEGRAGMGFGLGFLLGPIGLVIVAILRGQPRSAVPTNLQPCPVCAEMIQPAAIKCRFCGAAVEPVQKASAPEPESSGPRRVCWNCAKPYDAVLTVCPHCGKTAPAW